MLMSAKEIYFRAKKNTTTSTLCGKFNEIHLINNRKKHDWFSGNNRALAKKQTSSS